MALYKQQRQTCLFLATRHLRKQTSVYKIRAHQSGFDASISVSLQIQVERLVQANCGMLAGDIVRCSRHGKQTCMITTSGILFQTLYSLLAKLRMYFRLRPVPDDSGGIFWCHWWYFLVPVVVFALLRLGKSFFGTRKQRQRKGSTFAVPQKNGERKQLKWSKARLSKLWLSTGFYATRWSLQQIKNKTLFLCSFNHAVYMLYYCILKLASWF